MPINKGAIVQAAKLLGLKEAHHLYKLATKQEKLESKWRRAVKEFFQDLNAKTVSDLVNRGEITHIGDEFELFFMEHMSDVVRESANSLRDRTVIKKLARGPYSLKGLQRAWDVFRKTGKLPKDLQRPVDKLKNLYVKKCQDVWRKEASTYVKGKDYNLEKVEQAMFDATKSPYSRAKMIVETETTRYYNETRREYFDRADDITHYLFMSIRDHRTTKWCKTRHGLVYEKSEPVTDKETPPCHWNCRSEMVPLTRANPKHQAIIKDKRRDRRTHKPEPLPKGWND